MKIENLVGGSSADVLIKFLDSDKSGEVYSLSELAEKISIRWGSVSLRPSNPKLKGYWLRASARSGQARVFYGNQAVIERAKKYTREAK